LLPARRNALDSEQAHQLGHLPDRDPGRDGEGQGESPDSVQPELAAILERRVDLGTDAYVFGSANGTYQPNIQTAWETLRLLAYGVEPKSGRGGAQWNQEQLRRIDLPWHDLRHEGACRLLADGVDIRIIQLMLGHASIQQTQRYLNVTDEELRRGLEVSWKNQGGPLRLASGS
jgi:integrase